MELNELRKIAEAATPGPWIIDSLESGEHGVFVEEGNPDYRKLGCASAIVASHLVGKNAEYLEAFDPDTVLALLSRFEQAEQAREQAVVDYEAAEIKVHRVRELHGLIAVFVNRDTTPTAYCAHCYDQQVDDAEYPCPTIRALDGDPRADV